MIRAELRATLFLAVPMIVAQLALFGQLVVEAILAGHLDGRVLAAVALGGSIGFVGNILCSGVMLAVPPSVAQLDGALRRGEVAALFRQALLLALAVGLVLGAVSYWGGPALIAGIGTPPDLARDATAYLHASALGLPAVAVFFACRGTSEGLSMPRPTVLISAASLIVLLPLGYTLMYNASGVAAQARGAGLAGCLVSTLEAVIFAAWLRFGRPYRGIGWGHGRLGLDWSAQRGLLRIGLPMAGSLLMESGMFSAAALAIGRFGAVQVASHQIALNVAGVAFMVPLGIAYAMTVRIGRAVGEGDRAGIRRAGVVGFGLVLCSQTLSSALIFSLRWPIARLYTTDPEVVAGAAGLLLLAGVFQFGDGFQVAANGALRGIKDARVPMLLTAIAYAAIGLPLGLYLAVGEGLAARGMWVGLIAGLTTAAILLSWRFVRLSRHLIWRGAPTTVGVT